MLFYADITLRNVSYEMINSPYRYRIGRQMIKKTKKVKNRVHAIGMKPVLKVNFSLE